MVFLVLHTWSSSSSSVVRSLPRSSSIVPPLAVLGLPQSSRPVFPSHAMRGLPRPPRVVFLVPSVVPPQRPAVVFARRSTTRGLPSPSFPVGNNEQRERLIALPRYRGDNLVLEILPSCPPFPHIAVYCWGERARERGGEKTSL